jgi:polysaccharide transporter, PST family
VTKLVGFIKHAAAHELVHNLIALYGVHVARYLLPLIVVPYLARVLTPSGWGTVAFAQGFSLYLTLIVEYGFNLSATREIARSKGDHHRISDIIAGVTGAKFILSAISILISLLLLKWVPIFREQPLLLWSATFAAVAQSLSFVWLFQGLERMKLIAAIDVSSKTLQVAGVFMFVHGIADGWKVLALQGLASLVAALAGFVLAYRWFAARLPTVSSVGGTLRLGWTMFLFRSSVSLYTVGNSFILGMFVAPEYVGYYAGAEKITKLLVGLFDPITQTMFPRLSYLVDHARAEAQRLARHAFVFVLAGGTVAAVGLFLSAPTIVRIALGAGFGPAVPALRILSVLPIVVGLSSVLGIQWMLPLRMDRVFNYIILSAGLINIILAVALAPRYAHLGMAWAVVVAEVFVTFTMYVYVRRAGVSPFSEPDHVPSKQVPSAANL